MLHENGALLGRGRLDFGQEAEQSKLKVILSSCFVDLVVLITIVVLHGVVPLLHCSSLCTRGEVGLGDSGLGDSSLCDSCDECCGNAFEHFSNLNLSTSLIVQNLILN